MIPKHDHLDILTHPGPDCDATCASTLIWRGVNPHASVTWLFSTTPRPEDHNPAEGRYVVDVGGAPGFRVPTPPADLNGFVGVARSAFYAALMVLP